MAAVETWYKDNSMTITQTVVGSGTSAVLTGTLLPLLADGTVGATVWTASLTSTGSDAYAVSVDPASASVTSGLRYLLRVAGTYGGRTVEFERLVDVMDRAE